MISWLSWLFKTPVDAFRAADPREELRSLKIRRRELFGMMSTRREFGFDNVAGDDEQTLKAIDRRILALQLKLGSDGGGAPLH